MDGTPYMTIRQLTVLSNLLKITVLAKETGINPQTLWGKIRRGTELSVVESDAIERVLEEKYALKFDRQKSFND